MRGRWPARRLLPPPSDTVDWAGGGSSCAAAGAARGRDWRRRAPLARQLARRQQQQQHTDIIKSSSVSLARSAAPARPSPPLLGRPARRAARFQAAARSTACKLISFQERTRANLTFIWAPFCSSADGATALGEQCGARPSANSSHLLRKTACTSTNRRAAANTTGERAGPGARARLSRCSCSCSGSGSTTTTATATVAN
jgi:hypothetical protein